MGIGEFKSKLFLPKVIGSFVIEDQTFSYWISALNQTIYKTTKILPPLTTVNIRDDGDLGTLQFNTATFNCSEVHEKNTTCQIYIDRVGRPNFKSAITTAKSLALLPRNTIDLDILLLIIVVVIPPDAN